MYSAFQSRVAGGVYAGSHVGHEFGKHLFCYFRVLIDKIPAFGQISGQVVKKTFSRVPKVDELVVAFTHGGLGMNDLNIVMPDHAVDRALYLAFPAVQQYGLPATALNARRQHEVGVDEVDDGRVNVIADNGHIAVDTAADSGAANDERNPDAAFIQKGFSTPQDS